MTARSPFRPSPLLATLALAGCMVGPKYKSPSVPTAPSFKELTPAAAPDTPDWQTAKPQDTIPRGDW